MPDLPSGIVTFLFMDIEGSTPLWERDRGAMAAAVARDIVMLHEVIQAHDGIHFKTAGDAVQAAFTQFQDRQVYVSPIEVHDRCFAQSAGYLQDTAENVQPSSLKPENSGRTAHKDILAEQERPLGDL